MVRRNTDSMMARNPLAPVPPVAGQFGDPLQSLVGEHQLNPLIGKELGVLPHQGVFRLLQHPHQGVGIQLMEEGHHREAADEFGDQPKPLEILRLQGGEQLIMGMLQILLEGGLKTDAGTVRLEPLAPPAPPALERLRPQ